MPSPIPSKPIWKSKTFWLNALTAGGEVVQLLSGTHVVPPGALTITSGLINIGLRLVTDSPVHVVPKLTD